MDDYFCSLGSISICVLFFSSEIDSIELGQDKVFATLE